MRSNEGFLANALRSVQALLGLEINLNQSNQPAPQQTLLQQAAQHGRLEIIQHLLAQGVNLNQANPLPIAAGNRPAGPRSN